MQHRYFCYSIFFYLVVKCYCLLPLNLLTLFISSLYLLPLYLYLLTFLSLDTLSPDSFFTSWLLLYLYLLPFFISSLSIQYYWTMNKLIKSNWGSWDVDIKKAGSYFNETKKQLNTKVLQRLAMKRADDRDKRQGKYLGHI